MGNGNQCPLCDKELDNRPTLNNFTNYFTCPRCGNFKITLDANEDLPTAPKNIKNKRYLLSGKTRTYFESFGEPLLLTNENIESTISNAPRTISDRTMALLKFFANRSDYIGKRIRILPESDYPVAFLKNGEEFSSFLSHIKELGLMKYSGGGLIELTLEGWEEYEHLQQLPSDSNQVFLAMKFPKKDSTDDIDIQLLEACENGFIPGIKDTGHDYLKIDEKQHNRKICEEILYEIKQSKFLVADVTGQRGGVYFEAGYALALEKEVVWTCHESEKNIHFDTRQYNRITWKNAEDLRKQLKNRIFGSVGRGKNKVKSD